MRLRKFEIIDVTVDPGGAGPERLWSVSYRAIKDKVWEENKLWIVARTEAQARERAMNRFYSGK